MNIKYRVSEDITTGETIAIEKKTREYNLDFCLDSKTGVGIRISANTEEKVDMVPINYKSLIQRSKRRQSFVL